MLKNDIFYIGGGTCCGKSTITKMLTDEAGYQSYKMDDDLFVFLDQLAEAGNKTAIFQKYSTPDEIWLRDPHLQNTEERAFYKDMVPLSLNKIEKLQQNKPIIAEGAGFLPECMHALGVPKNRYVCIVPTRDFRLQEYKKRPWISQILEGSSDPEQAFANWMERDALFSEAVLLDAQTFGYPTFVVDGKRPVCDSLAFVKDAFGLR